MRITLMLSTAAMLICVFGSEASAGPVVIACGPGQHAMVRNTFVRAHSVTEVDCVHGHRYRPTIYRTRDVRYRTDRRHRSWGKTALIVGGSAGTGAGIGGLVHGGKGALIGAALGGGAASIYEGARRR